MKPRLASLLLILSLFGLRTFAGEFDYELTDTGKFSLASLEKKASLPWWPPLISGTTSLILYTAAIIPGEIVCRVANLTEDNCFVSRLVPGIIAGGLGTAALFFTGLLIWTSYEDYQEKNIPLIKAKLIKEAYALVKPTPLEQLLECEYGENKLSDLFQLAAKNNPSFNTTLKELAEKFIIANECGYFVMAQAYTDKDRLSEYLQKNDVPDINDHLKNLRHIGSLSTGYDVQATVNYLFKANSDELKENHRLFGLSLDAYKRSVNTYLSDVALASIRISLEEENSLSVDSGENH